LLYLHYSAKVLNGQLTRREALEIIIKDPDPDTGGMEALDYCLKKLDCLMRILIRL
jgi:hypothetical protein